MKIVHALVEIVYMYKDKKNQWLCKFVHQSKSYNFTKTPRAKTIKEIAAIFHALCRWGEKAVISKWAYSQT